MKSTIEVFEEKWFSQLTDMKYILHYLKTYPTALSEVELSDIISPSELLENQNNWVELCGAYSGLEKEFFQPHWVPLNKTTFDLFIDISDPNYPIFSFHFSLFKPYKYIKSNLFSSINDLMLSEDEEIDLKTKLQGMKNQFMPFPFGDLNE